MYTIETLIAMDAEMLKKAAKSSFSIMFDPCSELGRREMARRMVAAGVNRTNYISPAVATIIGSETAKLIEDILAYQGGKPA